MKKTLTILATLALVAAISIGGTLAYLTAKTDAVTNTFTVGNVAITLDEAKVEKGNGDTWIATPGADRVTENTYTGVYPGAELPKDPTVTVGANSSDTYVRVKVTVSHAAAWKTACGAHGITNLATIFSDHDEAKWKRADITEDETADTITYVYNYIKDGGRLSAGQNTGALFTSVTIPAVFTGDELAAIGTGNGFTMNIVADAIQAEGFTSVTAAFAAFDA